jgi:hypothetical protein
MNDGSFASLRLMAVSLLKLKPAHTSGRALFSREARARKRGKESSRSEREIVFEKFSKTGFNELCSRSQPPPKAAKLELTERAAAFGAGDKHFERDPLAPEVRSKKHRARALQGRRGPDESKREKDGLGLQETPAAVNASI